MGAVPKRKISTRRKGKRRLSHIAKLVKLTTCSKCGSKRRHHQACPECGFYKEK